MTWISLVTALSSAIAAVLAWAAKLYWGKEYAAAKDEVIKAKDAQIELLKTELANVRDLTPMKIREYFLSVKAQMEEYNELLQKQLSDAKTVAEDRASKIAELELRGSRQSGEIEQLQSQRADIEQRAAALERQIKALKEPLESWKVFSVDLPKLDSTFFDYTTKLSGSLDKYVVTDWSHTHLEELSKSLKASYEVTTTPWTIHTFNFDNAADQVLKARPDASEAKANRADPDPEG